MLTQLHIQDFTIIARLDLELGLGMTALTGETGAGKSILVDALGLVLGDRADSGVVRHGCDKAEIAASFDISARKALHAWLLEQGLEGDEDQCLLRRVITAEGRSRGYVNGRPVPMQTLQALGDWLVDIHGQHAHHSLLKRDVQRQLVDDYAGHAAVLDELRACHQRWKSVRQQLDELQRAARDRDARLDLLRYQVSELNALALGDDELETLEAEHTRLANANRLTDACQRALDGVYENDEASLINVLGQYAHELELVQRYDERLAAPLRLLQEAAIQLEEAAGELRHYLGHTELDPARLSWVESRLDCVRDLSRKHHISDAEVPALHARLQQELGQLEQIDEHTEILQREQTLATQDYLRVAKNLSRGRKQAATRLAKEVSRAMQTLGMPGGRFTVTLSAREPDDYAPSGMEHIDFEVSANPGLPLKPLAKVASGGELSRISLAIQVITAHALPVPTLVFDEVDVGIGGGVAEIVGQQLRALGASRQVLCVTHLPQVAALAHHHLQVSKRSDGKTTVTAITPLSPEQRCEEIARMLGGVEITAQTRAHAKEMVTRAQAPG